MSSSRSLTGGTLIAGVWQPGTGAAFHATDPVAGTQLPEQFRESGPEQVAAAASAAADAAHDYRALSHEERARLLEAVAERIDALGDALTERVVAETALPAGRATGERGRTVNQLRMFAQVVRDGDFLDRRHVEALPDRLPLPRPDLRLVNIPVGPVAVFGASNFPLAFSVAGGDTASALAAGCPVVVKAHPAHPGVSEMVATALSEAIAATGVPAGVFSMVHGGADIGQVLVQDPHIRAVGFTGSRRGGLAIMATAQDRPVPIPVYAEMSSVNPVIILPGALSDDTTITDLANAYVGSLTREAGQYCTNPGLLFLPEGAPGDAFLDAAQAAAGTVPSQSMLTGPIGDAFGSGVQTWSAVRDVTPLVTGSVDAGAATPSVLTVPLAAFTGTPALHAEVFGPAGLVVRYGSTDDLADALAGMEGQLTATVHGTAADHAAATRLLPVLEDRAGRILWGGWPTGVEVSAAMVHGGPYPATSAPATTSVGTKAIERFLRPVSYQDFPTDLLPPELR